MSKEELEGLIEIIKGFTGSNAAEEPVTKAYEKYSELKEEGKNDLVKALSDWLKWIAEDTKSVIAVKKSAALFISDPVVSMSNKYSGDIASEVFECLGDCIHKSQDSVSVEKYVSWMGNGQIGKLLDFAKEMNGYQNSKMKSNILSILYVDWSKTERFNEYAAKIYLKKMALERKVELLSILRDMVNSDMEKYADTLTSTNQGLDKVGLLLHSDLDGVRAFNDASSIRTGVKFVNDSKKMANAPFLLDACKNFGSLKKWIYSDDTAKKIMDSMKDAGFDADFYVANGKVVAYKKGDAHYSSDWTGAFRSIMFNILGSKKEKTLPRVSIPGVPAGRIYKEIAKEYQNALNGDKGSAKEVTKQVTTLISKNFEGKKIPKAALEILNKINALESVLDYGGTVSFRGARITARVWKRAVPDDLYDSEILRCCIFLPNGEEKEEIPLFILDPKTTMVQFYIDGIKEPIAAATFYAGTSEGRPALLMDTWEAGSLAYAALSYAKMQNFALDTMLKFARKVNAEKLLIFADSPYGRPEEFCGYLRSQQFKGQKVEFEAIDSGDSLLGKYSKTWKHHYTDAFENGRMKGTINAFVFDCRQVAVAKEAIAYQEKSNSGK